MNNFEEENEKITHLSDDTLDALAALTLIAVSVMAVVFWLSDMPY